MMSNIDLIAGYFVGKVEKKLCDKEKSYADDILIPARFVRPKQHIGLCQGCDLIDLKEELKLNWPVIEGKIRYLLSLYLNEEFLLRRDLKIWPEVCAPAGKSCKYLAISYTLTSISEEGR